MIYLATGWPEFRQDGDLTHLTIPSGNGSGVQVALTRNQLTKLAMSARDAMEEAYKTPHPEIAQVTPFRRTGGT